uniref:Uncharacterized protein n=1 Tax=Leersia perrieri TaxID=77586 RepID=A0A0D9WJX8_9ORYZ
MPSVGNPDADLVPRVLFEIAYLCCIHHAIKNYNPSMCLISLWDGILGGSIFLACNVWYLVLDKIGSPNARPWRRYR